MMGLFGENPTWGYFFHNLHHALQSCMKFLSHTLVSIGVFKKSNIFCIKPEVVWELCVPQRFPIAGLVCAFETERVRRWVWGTSDSCQVPCSSPTLPAGWTPGGTLPPLHPSRLGRAGGRRPRLVPRRRLPATRGGAFIQPLAGSPH